MRPPPIRVRLTAWYLVVIFASLALYSLATYFGLRKAIEDTVDHQLQVRTDNIQQFLTTKTVRHQGNAPQLLPESSGLGPGDELYQVSEVSDTMIYQSAAMHELDVPIDTVRVRNHYRHHRDNGNFTTYYRRARDVRVLSSNVQVGSNAYRIQVATFVSPLYEALDTFRIWTWIGFPFIICVAGLGGHWLSGRAMKPVHNLVLSTREISERNLANRIPMPAAQDELSELAMTMNQMLGRLEEAFTRVTRFTSDASHELRTPITVIRTTSEVILERDRSTEQYKEMVGQLLKESESASVLIEQLLTLARSDAETEQLSFEQVDLCELVAELDPGSRTFAKSHDLHWSSENPREPVIVMGNQPHLRRLLLILIDNACRYTEKGGSVRLRLTSEKQDIFLEVMDTGIGIPPEELTQIFERFYRASNARFFYPHGSGLGLSIAHWIATAHGGSLTAKSTVGSGTCMMIALQSSGPLEGTH